MIEINGLSDITLVSLSSSFGIILTLVICLITMARKTSTNEDDLITLIFKTLLITMVINVGLLIHL